MASFRIITRLATLTNCGIYYPTYFFFFKIKTLFGSRVSTREKKLRISISRRINFWVFMWHRRNIFMFVYVPPLHKIKTNNWNDKNVVDKLSNKCLWKKYCRWNICLCSLTFRVVENDVCYCCSMVWWYRFNGSCIQNVKLKIENCVKWQTEEK